MTIRFSESTRYRQTETPATKRSASWTTVRVLTAIGILQFSAHPLSAVDTAPSVSGVSITNSTARPTHLRPPVIMNAAAEKSDDTGKSTFGIHPINSQPYGLSYSEWSAKWWQWILQIPAATNPNLDATGAHCGEGQSGNVWFLAGSFGTLSSPIDRHCTIPTGTSVFLPVLDQADGAALLDCDGPPPFNVPCANFTFNGKVGLDALREEAKVSQDNPASLQLIIDNVPVANIPSYRVQSPVFSFTLTTGNVITAVMNAFGIPATQPPGTYSPAVADGYYVMFTPLTPGLHTIHFEGVQAGGFATGGITYHLNVVPKGQLQ